MAELIVPFNDLSTIWTPHLDRLTRTVSDVLRSGWFLLGGSTERFEAAFAARCGVDHCVGVGNGTDALELALRAVGVEAGDEVVLTANAGGYATTACRAIGATPVFVDVHDRSGVIDVGLAARACGDRTAAIVMTHLYGHVADVDAMLDRCGGVPVVEDCAQAHGALLRGRSVGGLGTAAAFSFYPTKNLGAVGDAGAVTTTERSVADAVRSLRRYGWTERYRTTLPGGRNSRIDEIQAAVLTEFLPDLEMWNNRRAEIHGRYVAELGDHVTFLAGTTEGADDIVHLSVARVPDRTGFVERARQHGVQCEMHFPVGDHRQPGFQRDGRPTPSLPVTEGLCSEVVSLPCHPGLDDAQVDAVVNAVKAAA